MSITVADLIKSLQEYPQDAVVIHSRDSEGNGFSPVAEVSLGRTSLEDGESEIQFGLDELTPELEAEGYTEEDVGDGPIAVCVWPV